MHLAIDHPQNRHQRFVDPVDDPMISRAHDRDSDPRWTAYDAKRFGITMRPEVPMTVTDRAYTSISVWRMF